MQASGPRPPPTTHSADEIRDIDDDASSSDSVRTGVDAPLWPPFLPFPGDSGVGVATVKDFLTVGVGAAFGFSGGAFFPFLNFSASLS